MRRIPAVAASTTGPALYAEERGHGGVLLLLLHGLGGGASTWTAAMADLLGAHRRVVPDLLGFGRSPRPRAAAYTLDAHLAALEDLLAARGLGRGPLAIVGHSLGAVLALELAARHRRRLRGLALVGLPYFPTQADAWAWVERLGRLPRFFATGHWLAWAVCEAMCTLRPALLPLAPAFLPYVPPAVARDALRHSFDSYSRTFRSVLVQHRPERALARLADAPVVLVHGDADPTAPIENVRALAARFPAWRLVVLPGAGHLLPTEQPARLATLVEEALRAAARSDAGPGADTPADAPAVARGDDGRAPSGTLHRGPERRTAAAR